MKIYSQKEIDFKFRKKECLECEKGKLNYIGSSPQGGWVNYYTCDCCGTKYEFQESDMGQTIEDLRSNAVQKNKISKFKGTKGVWNINKHSSTTVECKGRSIATTGGYSDNSNMEQVDIENLANAKLISAAPELLKALSDIIESIDNDFGEFKGVNKESLYIKFAKQAINKATE